MRPGRESRLSAAGLLVGNAVPLVGVLAFGWSARSLLVVYWLESAAVGASFYAKIRRARGADDVDALPSMSFNDRSVRSFVGRPNAEIARFFVSHYGGFWVVHGFFVGAFVLMRSAGSVELAPIALSVVGLVGYHVVSFWQHVVVGDEVATRGPVALMVEPYRRVLVLHLTVVFGMFAVSAVGASSALVAVMVVVKTALDFRGHWREHRPADEAADAADDDDERGWPAE